MPQEKDFWESIDVPIKDVLDIERKFGAKSGKRLYNKLTKISKGFEPFVRQYYNVEGESFLDVISSIHTSSIDDFSELYALAIFAEKGINLKIIREHAQQEFPGKFDTSEDTDSIPLLLPLFKQRPEVLKEIYYENLFECKPKKRFESKKLEKTLSFKNVKKQKIETLLQEFESKRRADLRRPIKLWWFEPSGKIVFRREKNASSQLKLVQKNLFAKTGDEKVFVFLDDGKTLEMCSSREPLRTVKIAEFIVEKLTGQKIKYNPKPMRKSVAKISKFLQKILTTENEQVHILGIRTKNAPLAKAPMLELEHSETIIPAISELQSKDINLTEHCENVLNLRIKFEERPYNLKITVKGEEAEISIDNRNVRYEDKQKLIDFIDRQLDSV